MKNFQAQSDNGRHFHSEGMTVSIYEAGVFDLRLDPEHVLLDIYMNGVRASLEDSSRSQTSITAPGSFSLRRASSARCYSAMRSGRSLLVSVARDWLLRRLSLTDGFPDNLHDVFDTAMVGAAKVIADHLECSERLDLEVDLTSLVEVLVARLAYHVTPVVEQEPAGHCLQVQRAIEHIEAHLDAPLKLHDVASVAAVSAYHFARIFRQQMGTTVHDYIVSRRLERAQQHLHHGEASLAQIAYDCGFGSQSHMTTLFRRRLGRTPGEIRNELSAMAVTVAA